MPTRFYEDPGFNPALVDNLTFRYAQMNFGPVMATAAKLAVAEVHTVLDAPIPHDRVQLPGVFVDRVVAVGK